MTAPPTLCPADVGDPVRDLQSLLNTRLDLDPPLTVDGHFGPLTRLAVRAFQSAAVGPDGLPLLVDGVVGPLTWWALQTCDQTLAFDADRGFRAGASPCLLSAAVLDVLGEEVRRGAREVGSDNSGPHVARYAGGLQDVNWCSWFATWVIHEAARRIGVEPPCSHQGVARRVLTELEDEGLGSDEPVVGGPVVWWRTAPDSWQGHVGIVTDVADGVFWTIEANRGGYPAPVRQFSYVLERERRLLGFAQLCEAS